MARAKRARAGGGPGQGPPAPAAGPAQSVRRAAELPEVPAPHVLRDYSLLADGHRGVLVGPQGDCAWMCFPSWSDPAVFASLIGSRGHYLVQPTGRWVWGGAYDDGTLIWNSRWVTEEGAFESRDALAYPGRNDRAVLLRRLRAVNVPGHLVVVLDPRGGYGRRSLGPWVRGDGCWEVRGREVTVRWWGAGHARPARVGRHHRLELELELEAGAHHDLVLELTAGQARWEDPAPPDADALWRSTEETWKRAVPDCRGMVAARDVRRSFAVLRGMTTPEGGTVAAATTSLPERSGGDRNYDYRYVWVRDTCYIGRAGAVVPGGEAMLDDAVRWVAARLLADGDAMAPAYVADGTPVPDEVRLDLAGYPGGTDVVGNHARDQFQLDVFGEALLLLAVAAGRGRMGPDGLAAADAAASAVGHRVDEPDAGIWELAPAWWTSSRLVCAAGLRAVAEAVNDPPRSSRYLALADDIAAKLSSTCVHPSGRWQRAPDDGRVDASLLLAEIRGAVPADDQRSKATRQAVADELAEDGYVYRYAVDGAPLGGAEGAFLICNFWMALACLGAGQRTDGVRWFERARSSAGSPGLLSEECDVAQHQLRGNLPQAFVHALLIECAASLGAP